MERIQVETACALTLELVGLLDADTDWTGAAHSHPFWELLYLRNGSMRVKAEGLDGQLLTAGEMILIPPGHRHVFENVGDSPSQALYIGCRYTSSNAPEERFYGLSDYQGYDTLRRTLDILAGRDTLQKRTAFLTAQGLLLGEFCGIFVYLAEMRPPDRAAASIRSAELIAAKVKDYVKANISHTVTVKEVADSLYITPHYLGVTFRRSTGMTIHEYLLRVRMQKALDLIRTTSMPFADIAEQLGFDTPQYFSNSFRRYYGAPPSAYRK